MTKLHEAIRTAGELAPSTRERYLRDIDLFTAFAGDGADTWTVNRLSAFRYHLANTRKFTAGNIERIMSSVRTAMQLASTPVLTEGQVAQLLATCTQDNLSFEVSGLRDRAIITCIVETGINRAQLLGLKIETVLSEYDGVHALTRSARDAIEPWLAWLRRCTETGPLFRPLAKHPHQFRQFDQAMTAAGLQKMLNTRGTRAGIGHINVQMLRRVHARRNT